MRTKLFFLLSIFSHNETANEKTNRIKESILNVVEEIGAWLFIGGIIMSISWIAGILL